MKMTPLDSLISMEEAKRRLLAAAVPIHRVERIPLGQAIGRVAAREVRAPRPIPSFLRATWDGYAFLARDSQGASRRSPVALRVVGELHAEERLPRTLRRGECVAIATGAALPRGANTVELFENVQVEGEHVRLTSPVPPENGLALPGEDVRKGQRLVRSGEVLTPARIGAVGATGRDSIEVYAKPNVVLLPNGNELVPPGGQLAPGRIHEFNNFTLGALVAASGGIPLPLPPAPDDPAVLEGALEGALRYADLVIATGGSSVGERDFLATVFPRLGRLLFHGIRVRPGKPTLAAKVGEKLLLGMPGHPTSCLSNGLWLLLPLLRKLARLPGPGVSPEEARLATRYESPTAGFSAVLPVRLKEGWAYPTYRGSAAITSLIEADGYVLVPPSTRPLLRGAQVTVQRLPYPLA
ncbi:MAG: molybdopterin molybdotransferase MoeA [Euryarchaeota archaeon]|nr:molybdopterin molybdotransferase MoeA [Euryarchaeota archaeon]MDE1837590.1 molybdopterin molybdotransferase MoeA [Euryarchaeota archaeon]MDE1881243.1 molybdopterin molybdotransferase MoeA [Euryarchaeota archaeon]MDE2045901.1 molybdopterin molybdotransferase MoeA [Thermoplasmata archaeon]